MKAKQITLIIVALLISAVFLYPMYVSTQEEKYCESLKDKIKELEDESSIKDIKILKLENSLLETESELSAMNEEVKRLSDENGIFTSMLGEIETQPGGHEILKNLFNQFSDE